MDFKADGDEVGHWGSEDEDFLTAKTRRAPRKKCNGLMI
jgi:hypothetical protein